MKTTNNIKSIVLALAGVGLASLPYLACANPTGGQVVAGTATIRQETPVKVGITQTTDKAIIDWQKYSIGANEQVQYYQPSASSVTLNRVVGQDPSQILGRLTANGQVFLVNPNGIYFGKNAQIDVAGLVASTHNIRNEDFMAAKYNFNIPGKPGAAIVNEGMIRIADTGIAAFVAPSVANRGVIAARLGKVALAAANGFTLDFTGDQLLSFLVSDEVAKTAFDIEGKQLTSFVENSGRIEAQGGYVLLTAKAAENAIHSVINQSGTIEATSVGQQNGEIVLAGGLHGVVSNTGKLDVSGKAAGQTGGKVQITGNEIALRDGTKIDASGQNGGGKVLIGGDYLGGNASASQQAETGITLETRSIPTAHNVRVDSGSSIDASAIAVGDGGKVIVWAENRLDFEGHVSSRGGKDGGDGGHVETSGKQQLFVSGTVDAGADKGQGGLWFMDPLDAVIGTWGEAGVTHSRASISAALNNSGTTVTIQSDNGARPGSITLLDSIVKTAGGTSTLNLFSDGVIILNRGGRIVSTSGALNVNINARYNVVNPAYGLVAIGNDAAYAISSNGGDVDVEGLIQTYQGLAVNTDGGAFRARTTPAASSPQADSRGFIGVGPTPINQSAKYTIDTGAGNISMRATGGTITLDNHALATRGSATLTATNVLAQPNILAFNMADESNRQNIESGLGGASGYGATFPGNDDNSTPVDISLLSSSQGLTVLGRNYGNNVYLSNNGYMRLDTGDSSFTPYSLSVTSNPIVAAYFGDVDTRSGIGSVYYGTLATSSNNKAVLTWVNAGYYSVGADKRNTFQLQLENLGQEINMRMSYNQLQWTTGSASGGSGGLGGTVARAGFSIPGTDQTVRFELPASGSQNDMLALAQLPGNTGYAGRWSFRLWSGATPPSKSDGRYEVAANSLIVKNDAGQVVSNRAFELGAYSTGGVTNETADYRRSVDYGSRLDGIYSNKYDIKSDGENSESGQNNSVHDKTGAIDPSKLDKFLDISDSAIKAIGYASNVIDFATLGSNDFASIKSLVIRYSEILKSTKGYTKVLKGADPDALLDAIIKLPTEDAEKVFGFLANNDRKGLASYLKTIRSGAAAMKQFGNALELLGKFFTALTVTTEVSELLAKIVANQATTESYAKAGLNSSVAIGTWIAGTASGAAAAAGGLIYAAIPLGKTIAEFYTGEGFDDSQQRYLTGIVQMQNTLSVYDNGTVSLLAKNGDANLMGDIKNRTQLGRVKILESITQLDGEIADLNSVGSRLAHGFNFSSDERRKIVSELTKVRDGLSERFTQYEVITTHLALVGSELNEAKIKIEISNKANNRS